MTENEKKKPDYTNSAENLCNPPEVKELLDKFQAAMALAEKLKKELYEKNESLMGEIEAGDRVLQQLNQDIRQAIETYGSFQDIEAGVYAVKYRRMTRTYHVEPFKRRYEKFVPAVVEETINVKALEGLVKGGLISGDDLKHPDVGVITETPTYAYYIR